jgi:hypothetical protein
MFPLVIPAADRVHGRAPSRAIVLVSVFVNSGSLVCPALIGIQASSISPPSEVLIAVARTGFVAALAPVSASPTGGSDWTAKGLLPVTNCRAAEQDPHWNPRHFPRYPAVGAWPYVLLLRSSGLAGSSSADVLSFKHAHPGDISPALMSGKKQRTALPAQISQSFARFRFALSVVPWGCGGALAGLPCRGGHAMSTFHTHARRALIALLTLSLLGAPMVLGKPYDPSEDALGVQVMALSGTGLMLAGCQERLQTLGTMLSTAGYGPR